MTSGAAEERPVTGPRWIAPTLKIGEGQDPLGLQSMTQDR